MSFEKPSTILDSRELTIKNIIIKAENILKPVILNVLGGLENILGINNELPKK